MIEVSIGRDSGPCTDKICSTELKPSQVDLFMDVIAMVNQVTNNHERWWVEIDGKQTIPTVTPIKKGTTDGTARLDAPDQKGAGQKD